MKKVLSVLDILPIETQAGFLFPLPLFFHLSAIHYRLIARVGGWKLNLFSPLHITLYRRLVSYINCDYGSFLFNHRRDGRTIQSCDWSVGLSAAVD